MPPSLKRASLSLLALSIAFCLFFEASKHQPLLSNGNPFAEDPYDAVGSFAIQYAVFISALSLLRAFRPYPAPGASVSQHKLIAAGQVTGFAAIAVTLFTDLIALIRHPEVWSPSGSGRALLTGISALLLSDAFCILAPLRYLSRADLTFSGNWRRPALALPLLSALCLLAIYPESFRLGLFGALATVVAGALCLFVPLYGLAESLAPPSSEPARNLHEDLATLVIGAHSALTGCAQTESTQQAHLSRLFGKLLGPRVRWLAIALSGALIGASLALAELRDGGSMIASKRLLILAAYVGLEMTAVMIGFALLHRPLRLSNPNLSSALSASHTV